MNVTQNEKLRALLEHARRTTARYANALPPLTEASDPAELLKHLRPLTKQDLRRDKARLYSLTGDTSSWRVAGTTGTTGEPVEVVLDERSRGVETLLLAEHFDKCLNGPGWRARNLIHLVLHAGATTQAAPSPWGPSSHVKWNFLRVWQASEAQFVKGLEHVGGHVVTTMPSVAQLLCERLKVSNHPIRPSLVLLSGEAVEPDAAAQIAGSFNCPVTSLYTMTEAGIVGRPCGTTHSYHVEERNVFLEILDENARPVEAGGEGEIVVTPLENYAMPLIRYRTGDRGVWVEEACGCGDPAPSFRLATARRAARLVTTKGAAVNVVRFAKIFASLELERYGIAQKEDGAVVVSYLASRQLDNESVAIMKGAVRAALGPEVGVRVRRVSRSREIDDEPGGKEKSDTAQLGWKSFEPDGPHLADLAGWLRDALAEERGIECAILTGSSLDPDATSRFSDIDLALFLKEDVSDPRWIKLARRLRVYVPKLSVNIDRLDDLPRRAPLVTCRLLREQFPVVGRLDSDVLGWPSKDDLRSEGRLWAQQAAAALWHQLTSPPVKASDPVREAWVAAKYGLNALRYRYLVRGELETAPLSVITRALRDRDRLPWLDDLIEAFDVAREHRPPSPTPEQVKLYFTAAWFCVYSTAREVLDQD